MKFTAAALDMLQQHTWRGNVRKLRNVVNRALLLRKSPRIDTDELTFEEAALREPEGMANLELPVRVTLEGMLQRLERQFIENTLHCFQHNRERTARALGLSRASLYKLLKVWGLGSEDEEESG